MERIIQKSLVENNSESSLPCSVTLGCKTKEVQEIKKKQLIDETIIGKSNPIKHVKDYLLKVAAVDCNVFITGETGTGKELVAEQIHINSSRKENPFICINCAAIPENLVESEMFGYEKGAFTGAVSSRKGKLELVAGGSAFFDEIGDMSLFAQAKILRALEQKEVYHIGGKNSIPVSARFIAATNHDPEYLLKKGKFREDLYYRLNVARVHLPPLRERKEDILLIMNRFLQDLNIKFGRNVEGFSSEVLNSLIKYDWPGNIRELKNIMEASFINMPLKKITFTDLPVLFQKRLKEHESLPYKEKDRLMSALYTANWNKSKAARQLQWSRMTLYRKMAKYNIISYHSS